MYFKTLEKEDCCGCSACVNICPKNCISFKRNEEGFMYPVKDMDICIDCGLCEKVCPFAESYTYETTSAPSAYAAYDMMARSGSSSGGVFYALAKYAIEECKGWVFGAAFEEKFQLRHVGVNNMADLQKLRGSKYLQSDMRNCYQQIRALLMDRKFVLFVGTPCQVAGLRAFLRNLDYETLLVADLVCHGVPSQSLFDEHVRYLEKKNKATLVSYQFRLADGWGGCEIADFANPAKRKILHSYDLSPYLYSFMYCMTYRDSCYNCKFAKVPRQGDITLADYWGVSNFFPDIDTTKGVSLVLVNTLKGKIIWNKVSCRCEIRKSNLNDAAKFNGNLVTISKRHDNRNGIYERINREGYENLAKTDFRCPSYFKKNLFNIIMITPGLNIIHKVYLFVKKTVFTLILR